MRALAQRSGQAAREIKQLIAASVAQVDEGAQLVTDASERIRGVVGQVRDVSELIDAITQSTVEQSSGITQVSTAVAQLDNATQQNAALVEQSAAAAQSLQEQAQQLARQSACSVWPPERSGRRRRLLPGSTAKLLRGRLLLLRGRGGLGGLRLLGRSVLRRLDRGLVALFTVTRAAWMHLRVRHLALVQLFHPVRLVVVPTLRTRAHRQC